MQENTDNKLAYEGDDSEGYSVYFMRLAGRLVFEVKVSVTEEGMPVYIRRVAQFAGDASLWVKTALRAFPVEDKSRVSAMSMKEAVYGNLPFLLADLLYGPKTS